MLKLYHYIHCPFCLRVRMALGKLGISYTSIPLPYDDEKTPIQLAGKKMLPIMEWSPHEYTNESLDIIQRLDQKNGLCQELLQEKSGRELDALLDEVSGPLYKLTMPYLVWSKEFNEKSRHYFQSKKEISRGPFYRLIQDKDAYLLKLSTPLKDMESKITVYYQNPRLTILDIILASHLWALYIFPEFQFSPALHEYLQRVKSSCRFDYHEDLWRDDF